MILDLFPLQTVLFPRSSLPLHIFEPRYLKMITTCIENETPFGVILLKSGRAEGTDPVEIHRVGTTAQVFSANHKDDGTIDVQVAGRDRFEVVDIVRSQPRMKAEVRKLEWIRSNDAGVDDLTHDLTSRFTEYLELLLALTGQWVRSMDLPDTPTGLAEFVSAGLQVGNEIRQDLLQRTGVPDLIRRQLQILDAEIPRLARAVDGIGAGRTN